jgi:hypothetical protein
MMVVDYHKGSHVLGFRRIRRCCGYYEHLQIDENDRLESVLDLYETDSTQPSPTSPILIILYAN